MAYAARDAARRSSVGSVPARQRARRSRSCADKRYDPVSSALVMRRGGGVRCDDDARRSGALHARAASIHDQRNSAAARSSSTSAVELLSVSASLRSGVRALRRLPARGSSCCRAYDSRVCAVSGDAIRSRMIFVGRGVVAIHHARVVLKGAAEAQLIPRIGVWQPRELVDRSTSCCGRGAGQARRRCTSSPARAFELREARRRRLPYRALAVRRIPDLLSASRSRPASAAVHMRDGNARSVPG